MHLPAPPFGLRKGPPGRYLDLWLSALPPLSQTTLRNLLARDRCCARCVVVARTRLEGDADDNNRHHRARGS